MGHTVETSSCGSGRKAGRRGLEKACSDVSLLGRQCTMPHSLLSFSPSLIPLWKEKEDEMKIFEKTFSQERHYVEWEWGAWEADGRGLGSGHDSSDPSMPHPTGHSRLLTSLTTGTMPGVIWGGIFSPLTSAGLHLVLGEAWEKVAKWGRRSLLHASPIMKNSPASLRLSNTTCSGEGRQASLTTVRSFCILCA